MLERHATASASLRSAERAVLAEQLAALEAALEPGLSRLNWTSLTIPEFAAGVNKVGLLKQPARIGAGLLALPNGPIVSCQPGPFLNSLHEREYV